MLHNRELKSKGGKTNFACADLGHRVGGGVTSAVLPHHRTYGSVYGGSRSPLETKPLISQR
jgi:hypothetical protein